MNEFSIFVVNAIVLIGYCWEYNSCVTLTGDITFAINYEKKDLQGQTVQAVHKVSIPTDSAKVNGSCEDENKQSSISLTWDPGFNADFVFVKEAEKDHWYAITCKLTYSNTSIPDAINLKNSTRVESRRDQELFLTRLTHYYQCNSPDSHPLYLEDENNTITTTVAAHMNTSNLVVKPFKETKDADLCSKDTKKPTDPPNPPTVPPKKPTDPPAPAPTNKPPLSGSRVAWTCTIVTVLVLCLCGIVIYHNKDSVPPYMRVV